MLSPRARSGDISVIVRSEATSNPGGLTASASHLDCFAELVIGPATSGRTRWLAMTRFLVLKHAVVSEPSKPVT